MNNVIRIVGFILGIAALALVRFYASEMFYDPLIPFFKSNFTQAETLPEIDNSRLMLHVSLRYWLNSIISLGLIYLAFAKKGTVVFSLVVYGVVWIIVMPVFWYFTINFDPTEYLKLFYTRRFLIQPLLLLILLPAFYYQKKTSQS
ncbi:MAG: exosortase F system-associated protein [Leeuwenhoekiella sp.]